MKTKWVLLLIIIGIVSISIGSFAGTPPQPSNNNIENNGTGGFRVFPTGDPDQDVFNVQWAVDHVTYDTSTQPEVQLMEKGKNGVIYFDFGTEEASGFFYPGATAEDNSNAPLYPDYDPFLKGKNTVYVYKSVTINGEGQDTTIIGGRPAFWIGWDGDLLDSPPNGDYGKSWVPLPSQGNDYYFLDYTYQQTGVTRYMKAYRDINVVIDNIQSEDAHTAFCIAGAGHDITVQNCNIKNVSVGDYEVWPGAYGINYVAASMSLTGLLNAPCYDHKSWFDYNYQNAINGSITVKNNKLNGASVMGIGCAFNNASVLIEENIITNVVGDGIHMCDIGMVDFSSPDPSEIFTFKPVTIRDNTIITDTHGIFLFGITLGQKVSITDNRLISAPNPLLIWTSIGSTISGNTFKPLGGEAVIDLSGQGSTLYSAVYNVNCADIVVNDNKCDAGSTATYGIKIAPFGIITDPGYPSFSRDNTFNDINFKKLELNDGNGDGEPDGSYIYCNESTYNNTFTNFSFPQNTLPYEEYLDDGDNDFTQLR